MNLDWSYIVPVIIAIIAGLPGTYTFVKAYSERKKIEAEALKALAEVDLTDAEAEQTQVETAGLLNKQAMALLDHVRASAKQQVGLARKEAREQIEAIGDIHAVQLGRLDLRIDSLVEVQAQLEHRLSNQGGKLQRERKLRQLLEGQVRDQQEIIDRLVAQVKLLGGTPEF